MKKSQTGFGKVLPPTEHEVTIYFAQAGKSRQLASEFYDEFNSKNWLTRSGKPIFNWKKKAWEYISLLSQ
ncbi:hypothetical protein [Sphingobacterium yanglingense]|uniref:Uncharacterized protein n=1 Tax=Sphingobacterium yanglingense TaxID=1437280 RepID=A0A4R6W509_9SPHI|nr:hypothetical protein [Sphingobacterium yanglingense]TDQ73797.1 hypothetical protein CLV99_4234 [Sphingobacterium yanglingense]